MSARSVLAALLVPALHAAFAAGASAPEAAANPALEGPTWRLTRLGAAEGEALLPGTVRAPTVRFAAGKVEGFSGCNNFGGGYALEPGHVVVGSLRSTMMACIGRAADVEAAFLRAFTGTLAYSVANGVLTLTPAGGDALAFRAEAPPRLAGVTWSVIGFNNGRQAVVGTLLDSALTLTFGDGTLHGRAGCNDFHASVQLDGERIRIGTPAATRKTCARDDLMKQERAFLAALGTAATWSIRAGRLELRSARGERVLTASVLQK